MAHNFGHTLNPNLILDYYDYDYHYRCDTSLCWLTLECCEKKGKALFVAHLNNENERVAQAIETL